MPWIGYEYWEPDLPSARRFLSLEEQRLRIARAAEVFHKLFGSTPFSACAPGYRANADTRTAWFETGVRVAQNGPGERKLPSSMKGEYSLFFARLKWSPPSNHAIRKNWWIEWQRVSRAARRR